MYTIHMIVYVGNALTPEMHDRREELKLINLSGAFPELLRLFSDIGENAAVNIQHMAVHKV